MAISSNATGLRPGVVTSTTRPTTPYTGQIIYETDTGYLRVWDGSAWDYLSQSQDGNSYLGAFGVLQMVESANDTTLRSSTSTTYTDTGLTVSITPKKSTSKILCLYFIQSYSSGANTGVGIRLVRGSTTLVTDIDNSYGTGGGVATNAAFYYLDSPATTSSTTYKIQFNRNQGANTAYVNASGAGQSRLMVIEVAL